jgi:hypothetical protein
MLSRLGFPAKFPSGAPYFRRALVLFWTLDAMLIAAFIIARFLVFVGIIRFVPDWLGIAKEYSAPESFNYFKWFVCVVCLAVAWYRSRVTLFACLAVLFAMVFADDMFLGHETFGQMLHDAVGIPPTLGIDGKQIGEMVIFGCMGVIALLLIALGYRLSTDAFWPFVHRYLIVIFLLGITGVLFDGVHHMASNLPDSRGTTILEIALTLIEDGGEMILASLAAAYAVGAAFAVRNRA